MVNHLVVYVKANLLAELMQKLDSKGWSAIDVEPRTKICWGTIAVFLFELVVGIFMTIFGVWTKVPMGIFGIICVAALLLLITSFAFQSTYDYTVICEYVGNDEYMDLTPFDDTDDVFAKNPNYKPAESNEEAVSTAEASEEK